MSDQPPTLTVFTPTYNRAHTLPRVFESLIRQSSYDFCWLVVDDGSTDETGTLVARWKSTAPFAIEYAYQPNQGKHNAHNAAVRRARTPLFMILDSDDELLPEAVTVIVSAWRAMSPAERDNTAGIWTLCRDGKGEIVGGPLRSDTFDASLQELRYRLKDAREMLPTFVTEVLRAHPFPRTAPGECAYIPETFVWSRITRTRPLRFLNVPCRIYHAGDGLLAMARNTYRQSTPLAYGYFAPLLNDLEWFWHEPQSFMLSAVQAARYGLFSGRFRPLFADLTWSARLLVLCAMPLALALLCRDRMSGRMTRRLGSAL
jgi:glycosyltransferase involved in cell wall biosynthesis